MYICTNITLYNNQSTMLIYYVIACPLLEVILYCVTADGALICSVHVFIS